MNALERIIRDEIRAGGPMRFDHFMDLALYHRELGYYAGPRPIGRRGDFMTSVSVGPLFGQLLARQTRQMARLLDEPVFWIVEQGAHDGQLAYDILDCLRTEGGTFFANVRYLIVEPSAAWRDLQREKLAASFGEKVEWAKSLQIEEEQPCGLFLSNELVDAFPVRLIEREAGSWKERCVVIQDENRLGWQLEPIEDDELRTAMKELPLPPTSLYRAEVRPGGQAWMRDVAAFLRRGYVMTLDYGFAATSLYAPSRQGGTLTSYRQHQRGDDVLADPGEQDLTAHVDFTSLAEAGRQAGLHPLGLIDQQRFLTGLAYEELSGSAHFHSPLAGQTRAWQMLTHPELLGTRFQVLLQAKDAPRNSLDGLRFQRAGDGWD